MKEDLISQLNTLYLNLIQDAERAKSRGGPEAMKIASRAKLIRRAIHYIEDN